MLDSLITSKTRIKLLLKFFSNQHSTSYLRGLAQEFNESTNSVRVELNRLTRAGFLTSADEGRTVTYRANIDHPLFPEINRLVLKHIGFDRIVENVINRLGSLEMAFVTGDYAHGLDTGIIDLVLVGNIKKDVLSDLIEKVEKKIKRQIRTLVLTEKKYELLKTTLKSDEAIWLWQQQSA